MIILSSGWKLLSCIKIVDKEAEGDKKWQPIAAQNAAAFAVLDKLPPPTISTEQPPASQSIFKVPNFLTDYFTGHEALLQNLHTFA